MRFLIIKKENKMKTINILFFNALFIFLFGCNDKGNVEVFGSIIPDVAIHFVDKEGNSISMEPYENKVLLDVLSVTDDKGSAVEFSGLRILEQFSVESPQIDRQYTIKYKVPKFSGEAIEELKLVFSVDSINSKFTKAWYNGEEISPIITFDAICPECRNDPQYLQDNIEEIKLRIKDIIYNGEGVVAHSEGFRIFIVIPVEK